MVKRLVILMLLFSPILNAAVEEDCVSVMRDVLKRLGTLEKKVEVPEDENAALKKENEHLWQLLNDLKEDQNEKSEKLVFPQGNGTSHYQQQNLMFTQDQPLSDTKTEVAPSRLIANGENRILTRQVSVFTTTKVVFRVAMSSSIKNLGSGQTIVYNEVLLNVGNAYNKFSGMLTAPVKGVYILFFSLYALPTREVTVEIVHNGIQIDTMYVQTGSAADHVTQSRTIPILLEQGDVIWVRNFPEKSCAYLYGGPLHSYNSFAGFLLYEQ